MSAAETARYVPRGTAAIDPQALGVDYPCASARPNRAFGPVAVVDISGPITHDPAGFDTYAAIGQRFDAALSGSPDTIVLNISSPGGDVSGSFDLARRMRKAAAAAGVKLVAFTGSSACSAAYVLACSAAVICCSDVAQLGSIGVIVQPTEVTALDAAQGVSYAVISSGERKADGNPHVKLSAEARDAIGETVDAMASVFFEHVGSSRARLTAKAAQALQAGIRVGAAAVSCGLADAVTSFDDLITSLGGTTAAPNTLTAQQPAASSMPAATPESGIKMLASLPVDLQHRFSALTAAGVAPDLARQAVALEAEAAAASLRGTEQRPPGVRAAAAPVAPAAAPPAPPAKPKPAPRPYPGELETIAKTHALVAEFHMHVAAGGAPEAWRPGRQSADAFAPFVPGSVVPQSSLTGEQSAELDAIFGLTPKATAGVVVRDGVQMFGVPTATAARGTTAALAVAPPAPAELTDAQRAHLDHVFRGGAPKTDVKVTGNVQSFGV